ncbi:hypothetical protein BDZ45DRAFT_791369 [Acephala macrosclerotiorum]|nr:hypothetical protein BDZ45DRAFT_791369 [Acephala macrosclerotiorum]
MSHEHRRRSRSAQYSDSLPRSLNQSNPRHLCAICEKPRSSRYHERHPIGGGQAPEPGICSRPKCAKIGDAIRREPPPQVIIQVCEIYNHYIVRAGQQGPPSEHVNTLERPHDRANLEHEEPPPAYAIAVEHHDSHNSSRLERVPQGNAVVELPAESSLAGRVEMPDNTIYIPYSARHRSARLPTIQEESPPQVNFLNKPRIPKM